VFLSVIWDSYCYWRANFEWKFNDRKNVLELNVMVVFLKAKGGLKCLDATGMSVL